MSIPLGYLATLGQLWMFLDFGKPGVYTPYTHGSGNMEAVVRSTRIAAAVLLLDLALVACGGADEGATAARSGSGDQVANETTTWFSIDEEAGTITTTEGYTYPIEVRGTLTVDGEDYEFVAIGCPIPESGAVEDLPNWVGYGYAPDGRPYHVNAAGTLAFNITYDADWRSTDTEFDEFSPDWMIAGEEMRIEEFDVEDPETGGDVSASIVVRCL